MEEEVTLWDTLQKIAELMGVENIEQDNSHSDRAFHLFPTVFNGPIGKLTETMIRNYSCCYSKGGLFRYK